MYFLYSNSIFDFIYLAPVHVRSGRLLERLGRPSEAAQHYQQVLRLYRASDPEFKPLVVAAEQGLARIGTQGSSEGVDQKAAVRLGTAVR